jgi:ABC-2 type transport system ATP-binding protein
MQPLEARRRLAYVPDFPFLYDKLTAWEFFRFTGEMFQLEPARIEKNAAELVARFHLEDFADRTLEGLSHGTRQRIAIVSALLHDPEVFVIDEPMVGLDPQHARVVKDVLKERSLNGVTVLVSTHQLSIAEEMADRIGIIHGGKLIAVGTREELRELSGASGPLEDIFLSLTAEGK